MANKRIKNKQLKKKAGLQGQRISKKQKQELAKKEAKRNKRANDRARRYNENLSYLKERNVPTSIITKSTSKAETQRRAEAYLVEQRKAREKLARERRYARKVNKLISAGFSQAEAEQIVGSIWHQKSDKDIESIIYEKTKPASNENIKIKADTYLYVGFAETNEKLGFADFKNYTTDELLEIIRDRLQEASLNPTGSESMAGVFVVESGSKEEMQALANDYYKRGYNFKMAKGHVKFSTERYMKVSMSNTYTQHNFLQMVCSVLCNAKNEMVGDYFDEFKYYCDKSGLPFLNDL